MSDSQASRPIVVVVGDVTMDWNLADTSPGSTVTTWAGEQRTAISFQPGGAHLLASVMERTAAADVRHSPIRGPVRPDDTRFHQSTALWARFPRVAGSDKSAWRVLNYLGLSVADDAREACGDDLDATDHADLLVIDDAALGFRDTPACWPSPVTDASADPWVVLKTACPVGEGALLTTLLEHHAARLVVITTAVDLRRTGIEVSGGLSWEASGEDLARGLTSDPALGPLSRAFAVVVSFGAGGTFVSHLDGGQRRHQLVFDTREVEGTWEHDRPGGSIGGTTCLTAAVAVALAGEPAKPAITASAARGVAALRALHQTGYVDPAGPSGTSIQFPFESVLSSLTLEASGFAVADVPAPAGPRRAGVSVTDWSILRDRHSGEFLELAFQIIRHGPEAGLTEVPYGRFGALVTADRCEIEGFRSVRNLIGEYCGRSRPSRPLSLAVFGPPGSGKSFAITQIARSLQTDDVAKLTFNLSQVESPSALVDAFHQIRDAGISALIPLVFWDEFDTSLHGESLGWLRHFLVPMQDGEFVDRQAVHPIGRAIFVFAGGTASRLEELGAHLATSPDDQQSRWRAVKGPDFLSRLRGAVHIVGPDPQQGRPADDPLFVVRRAIVMHSILRRTWPRLEAVQGDGRPALAVDDCVAGAMLGVSKYRHGVRSIESIIAGCRLTGETRFHRSALPPAQQLRLHVDAHEFLALARGIPAEVPDRAP